MSGRHQIKFGADVIVAHTGGNSKEFGGPIYLGQFIYNTCTQASCRLRKPGVSGNIANVKTYTQSYGNANYTVNDTLWSLFVQDDYQAAHGPHHQPRPALRAADLHRFPPRISRRAWDSPITGAAKARP